MLRVGTGHADVARDRSLRESALRDYGSFRKKASDFLWDVRNKKAATKFELPDEKKDRRQKEKKNKSSKK
jgi:hypothetical protein